MNKPWFDPKTGVLLLDEYVAEMPSFKKIMADNIVTDEEITEHVQNVVSLLKQLETSLTPELKNLTTKALCELVVLYVLQQKQMEQLP
ncbi:MAG: hypothetical protein B6D35_06025 [Candidatus Brocadia sp. UTAMX2]|jgi:hypothetical protein|nr:MAG: hypothetical protein B6D35_06025 [Candidatus Brocadia sp. UTAMX2]